MYYTGVRAPLPGSEYCSESEINKAINYLELTDTDYFKQSTDLTNGAPGTTSPTALEKRLNVKLPSGLFVENNYRGTVF